MSAPSGPIVVDRIHCGPPESANGGWISGLLAERVATGPGKPAVTVRLSSPPPLDTPLTVGGYGAVYLLQHGHRQIATASPSPEIDLELPTPATVDEATAAETRFEGLVGHPFPTCFSCGTGRDPGEALALRPGPLNDGTGRYAAHWTPREASVPLVWAALDCPGGWAAGIAGRPMVLGSMTAQVFGMPEVGVPHVVTSWQVLDDGRKHHSASMLHSPAGELLGLATAIWIAVDPESVRPAGAGA